MKRFVLPVLLIAVAALLAACGGEDSAPTPSDPQAAAGQALIQRSCAGCHSVDGSSRSGPSFKDLAGSQVELVDGRSVTADDAYLEKAIREPDADVVKGYSGGIMASAMRRNNFSDDQIAQMIAYIKSLGNG